MKRFIASLLLSLIGISASWSLPAPKYLNVKNWQACVNTVTKGPASFVCLPESKPGSCLASSWKELTEQQLIESCSVTSEK